MTSPWEIVGVFVLGFWLGMIVTTWLNDRARERDESVTGA